MNKFRADLHCHTTFSDGSMTPLELLKTAKEIGLSGIAITDHDSIEAYSQAILIAQELGIELISGAEFSAVHKGMSTHILAYSFALSNPIIKDFCSKHHQRREKRNRSILELLKQHQMPITEEEMMATHPIDTPSSRHTIGRPHIAQAMINKGYVETVNEAFKKYLGEEKLCYAPGESFSVEETIDLIHSVKGLAILAHPHLIENEKLIPELLKLPFDGLEGYYAKFAPKTQQRWVKIAEKRGWLITGGSDFHGSIKPLIPLGCSWVNESTFEIFQKHYQNNT